MKDTLYFALSNFANVKRSCHSYKLPPFERAVCCIRFYEGLTRAISSYTHLPIVDALRGIERDSQYVAKKRGLTLSAEDMGFYRHKYLPSNRTPYLIDNVVDTGNTAKAAVKALGCGTCCFICNERHSSTKRRSHKPSSITQL